MELLIKQGARVRAMDEKPLSPEERAKFEAMGVPVAPQTAYNLVHDGRYQEARKIKAEAQKAGYSHWIPWFRLHLGERDWKEVQTVIEHHRKRDEEM